MRSFVSTFLLLFLFSSMSIPAQVVVRGESKTTGSELDMPELSFRVMSYNIHSGIGMDKKIDYGRMAKVIADAKAELIGFQEVAMNFPMSPGVDPLRAMGDILKMKGIFGKAILAGSSGKQYEYGIGVMGKMELEEVEVIRFQCPSRSEARIALIVRLKGPRPVYFICTHFSCEGTPAFDKVRLEQVTAIMECVKNKGYFPAVLVGDFNAFPDSPCVQKLKTEWTLVDDKALTFPSVVPKVKIDYIAFYPKDAFSFRSFEVIDEKLASDHRPVIADLTLKRGR